MAKNIQRYEEFSCPKTYTVKKYEYIKEVNSFCIVLKHNKSGARVMLLSNDDDNKVFGVGFRTPPLDDTGTQHIIEHTVLCGSDAFPAKDPFVELVKGSLNTYLNASTYPDKTVYPIASTNLKDFKNLMHVYMDAVFFPNIYRYPEIFKQEGWHYELEDKDGDITYNGVVYNEMKGAYSSEDSLLEDYLIKNMYPDTQYACNSGGDPEVIPQLTREAYLDYHKKYYHPVNSYIYLYGDMDMEERLNWMDENYLSKFERIELDSEIATQTPFEKERDIRLEYAVSEDDDRENITLYSYGFLTDITQDRKLCRAMDILSYLLIDMPGAYLKEALVEKGLATDVDSDVCDLVKQSYFAIYIKGAPAGKGEEIKQVIKETLEKLVKEGISKKILEASVNMLEFRAREGDFGSSPKGLFFYLWALRTWLYDEDAEFSGLRYEDAFQFIRNEIDNSLFEDLIEKYFLNNNHKLMIELAPKKGLTQEKDKKTAEQLAAYKASLTDEEIDKLIEDTIALKKYQSEPSPKEDLEKIPLLKLSEIDKEARKYTYQIRNFEGTTTVFTDEHTNDIVYLSLLFEASDKKDFISFLSVYTSLLGYMDTSKHSYQEFDTLVNEYTGGLIASLNVNLDYDKEDATSLRFEVSTKVLKKNIGKAIELINEMINETSFEDEKRLADVIKEFRSRHKNSLLYAGHVMAASRAQSKFAEYDWLMDKNSGLGYYNYLAQLDESFADRKDNYISDLKAVNKMIFKKEDMLIAITSDEDGYQKTLDALKELKLPGDESEKTDYILHDENNCKALKEEKTEAYTTPAKVNYVAISGRSKKTPNYGTLLVAKNLLSFDYLWNNVRVKGGAYGAACKFGKNGICAFTSYRDPKLKETIDVYKDCVTFLREYNPTERDHVKTIIGTISGISTPLTPAMVGSRNLNAYLSHIKYETIQDEKDHVLGATVEDVKSVADYIEDICKDYSICVIGSEEEIKNVSNLFVDISALK